MGVLFDLSRACLELAREKAHEAGVELAGYEHSDAQNLTRFRDGSFDAVLLLGALYHLLAEEDRRRAIREAWRVLRPAGLLFAAFITRYAVVRWAAKESSEWILKNQGCLELAILPSTPLIAAR